MKNILITGANRGIGLALVEKVLTDSDEHKVYMGVRSIERGQAAVDRLIEREPEWQERLALVPMDVTQAESVQSGLDHFKSNLTANEYLFGLVNNAGMGYPDSDLREVLEVNTYGIKRVVEAFLPMMQPQGGRIVNMTSAAGPSFVEQCNSEHQDLLTNSQITWEQLELFLQTCLKAKGDPKLFQKLGVGSGSSYGISKAAANAYTLVLARENPHLIINACTPGFIETELTRPIAERCGKTPAEMGMKQPEDGTHSAMHLLFGEVTDSGHYYGSDALRSPMHQYRAPGTPAYTGT